MNKDYLKLSLSFFLIAINFLLLIVSANNFTVLLFYLFLIASVYFISETKLRIDSILLFSVGVLVMILVYHYWSSFYGNSYFLGRKSDDWQYDVLWSRGYIDKYGLSPLKLYEHLGILHNSAGYVYFVILLRAIGEYFGDYSTFLPRMLNIFILTVTAIYVSKIVQFYTSNQRLVKNSLYWTFLLPVLLLNSSHVFRDTIIMFIVVYFFFLLIVKKINLSVILKITVLLFIMFFFRKGNFLLLLILIPLLKVDPKNIYKYGLLGLAIIVPIVISFYGDLVSTTLGQITSYSEYNAERFGAIGSEIFSLPLSVGVVPRMIYLIFTPVPNFSSLYQFIVSINAFLQIAFFPILITGLLNKNIDRRLKIYFLVYFVSIAISTATFRHVMMFMPFGIIIIFLQLNKSKTISVNKYLNYQVILFLLFFISITLPFVF